MRRKTGVMLGVMAALIVGGAASAPSALAEQPRTAPAPLATPVCRTAPPSGSGWVQDSVHNSCLRCQEAGRRLEATGHWRTHCMILGGIGPMVLLRKCIACLDSDAAAGRPVGRA